jgi:GT2 family glycosyltransferase
LSKPKVLISVLNWNNWRSTVETVKSVLDSEYENYQIVILDNNSMDDSVVRIKENLPGTEVWSLKENLGYAGAHKKTAKFAINNKFDLLWILNNDVKVYPFTLTQFINAYHRHGKSLLGSVSLKSDGKTINMGGGSELVNDAIDESKKYNQYAGENFFETAMEERSVSDVGGASFMIPVPVIEQCGFLDTRFFLYGEEVDYCYKLRRKYNIQSIAVPSAVIIHRSGESFNLSPKLPLIKAYYFTRNCHLLHYRYPEEFKMERNDGLFHFLKYFIRHYFKVSYNEKNMDYLEKHYAKLGAFHALIRLRGKYFEPGNFLPDKAKIMLGSA